ncbi:hypothetical protein Hsero_0208 [Herbaspirillum seropedicae SmR1]|uniref:Uncharacterized protein n=1 Tax=Herbaspirillum seropedicae (strain SmR1) TaxID=757424 RepID=D8IV15_HERSS|nr:hypothetical protein Hsero_0208 [Herbaspirillum seropedicae SmR1]
MASSTAGAWMAIPCWKWAGASPTPPLPTPGMRCPARPSSPTSSSRWPMATTPATRSGCRTSLLARASASRAI